MTVRNVEIHLIADDSEARKRLLEDKALVDSLTKDRRIKISIDTPSGLRLDKLAAQFDKLAKRTVKPSVEVRGLKGAIAGVSMLDAKLTRLGKRRVTVNVDVKTDAAGTRAMNLFAAPRAATGGGGFGGGGGRGFLNVIGGFAGRFGNWFQGLPLAGQIPVGGTGLAIGSSLLGGIAGLIEALVPTLIGGGIAGLGVMGVSKIAPKQFSALTAQIQNAFYGSLAAPAGHSTLGKRGGGPNFVQTGPSFLTATLAILQQIGSFVGTIGPGLAEMFRASLPFLKMFVYVGEQAAKIMMPAFTQVMKSMTPFLPIIAQGLLSIVQGFAGFLKALGPNGMKAGAEIFLTFGKIIEGFLIGLGHTIDFLARLTVEQWHMWRDSWDKVRHYTAVAFDYLRHEFAIFGHNFASGFDQLRHDVAHWWDMLWNNTIGRLQRGQQDLIRLENDWRHSIANIWDGLRHEVAHIWDIMWNNTIGATIRFGHNVEVQYNNIQAAIITEIKKLPGQMLSLGKQALTFLWNGMKAVAPSILSWAKGFISNPFGLVGIFKGLLGIHSPSSVMYDIGKNFMLGFEHGVQSRVNSLAGNVKAIGGNVASWISDALKITHKPMSWLPALETLVGKESGGRTTAVNPTPVMGEHASGMWQMLPTTFASWSLGGSLWNPISEGIAAIRYIAATYGSPFNIPGLFSGNYQGYWKGGWVNEPVFGVGMQSGQMYGFAEHGPEYVSHGQGGGVTVNVYAHPTQNTDELANTLWLALRDLKRHRKQDLGLA